MKYWYNSSTYPVLLKVSMLLWRKFHWIHSLKFFAKLLERILSNPDNNSVLYINCAQVFKNQPWKPHVKLSVNEFIETHNFSTGDKVYMSIGLLTTSMLGFFLSVLLPSEIHIDVIVIERKRESNSDSQSEIPKRKSRFCSPSPIQDSQTWTRFMDVIAKETYPFILTKNGWKW